MTLVGLTRACQFGNHDRCSGTITQDVGFEPCVCSCHADSAQRVYALFKKKLKAKYPEHPWVEIWEREN